MTRLVLFSTRYPRSVLAGVVALTGLAICGLVDPWTGAPRLRIDPSFEKLLPEDDAGRLEYEALQARFDTGESFIVAVEPPGGVFSLEALGVIAQLEARLREIPEVASVRSIASVPLAGGPEDELLASSLLDEARRGEGPLDRARRAITGDPLYRGVLVSPDGGLAALHVSLEPIGEIELLEADLGRRMEAVARDAAPGWPVWIAGAPFLKAEMNRILNSELASQVPLVLAIMMLVSFAVFRTATGAWLPVATIALALVWTLGAMGWAGRPINIVTSIVPPLILVVGFAYTIHVVAEAQTLARRGRAGAHATGLAAIAFPIALTAVTTAAGFLSLGISAHAAIREFGAFGAAGVMASLLAALTFTPAVLAISPMRLPPAIEAREGRIDRGFEWLGAFSLRHRVPILAVAAALFLGSLAAATRIQVDTRIVENFKGESLVRQSYERLNDRLDGADVLFVGLEGPTPGSLLSPENLREVAALQRWLEARPEVGGTTSIVDYLEASGRAMGGPSPLSAASNRALVAQLLWLADGEAVDPILDRSRQATVVLVRSRATSSREVGDLVAGIEAHLGRGGTRLEGTVTGGSALLTRAIDDVSRDQARSLVVAFALIGVILAFAFRSLRFAALTVLLNALPVAVYFGALGVTGIPLNNATALLGCVVLGIAIDDTLHFVSRHRECARRMTDPRAAAAAALAQVGRPVTWTTAALCLGLLVLTTSDLVSQAQFGALGSATLFFAWGVDVLVTPALCSYLAWRPASGSVVSSVSSVPSVSSSSSGPDGTRASVVPVGWGALAFGPDHPRRDRNVIEQSLRGRSQ